MNAKSGLFCALCAFLCVFPSFGHDESREIGFEEKPGQLVSLDLEFTDETGSAVKLGELVNVPTILTFEYFGCEDGCGLLLTNLASTLGELRDAPGSGYRVVTVSIDERDTPEAAREKKDLAFAVMGRSVPDAGWRFLTGKESSFHELTDEVGFHYAWSGDDIQHPLGVVILSPRGKVVRYIKSTSFLPADLTFSIMEASTGTILPTVSRVARFCFSVDPDGRKLTFNALRVTGTVTLTMAAGFVLFLIVRSRKRRGEGA